jgi:hypothetical protein
MLNRAQGMPTGRTFITRSSRGLAVLSVRARRGLALLSVGTLAAVMAVAAGAAPAGAQTLTDSVTVDATAGLGTIPSNAIGLNTEVYDSYMNDAPIPGLLQAAGINALRYPGGSYSDIYNWETNVAEGGYDAPDTDFSDFMATAQSAGARPIITVNYGTGTPALAAAWVTDADVTNNYGIDYWEVGNEVFGNGTYGADWEADAHCDTTLNGSPVTIGSEPNQTYDCGPTQYAENVLTYMSAMKAADPNIHVCAVLTTPEYWPDGVTNSEYPDPWNQTVLSVLGSRTDCVIVHYYPGGSSAANMLTSPQAIPSIMSTLDSDISSYAGVNPSSVKVLVTETNSLVDQDTMPTALFAPDTYMTWLESGATNIDWWDEQNGPETISTVDGETDYGDGGLFSSGTSSDGTAEPPVDTPFEPYYGIEMLTKLGSAGDEMVTSSSSNALVRVHAVSRADGSLDVLIDNEDPSNAYTVSLTTDSFTASGAPTVYTLANNGTSITSTTQSSASSVTVQPYSLTVIQIPGMGGTGVPPPANASCAVDYAVTNSWPGGFQAAITITDNGSTAINPWTLSFSFPASGEAVNDGWDGTWSQSGQQVTVTAASWNSAIAANGGSVSIGATGTDTGQTTAPTVFYLNGNVCADD